MQDLKYWIALSTHQKIGARTFAKLYKRFDDFSKIWQTSSDNFLKIGLDAGQTKAILEVVARVNPDEELSRLEKYKVGVVTIKDEEYPSLLKEISDPPAVLYYRGKLSKEDEISLAVVGSRKFSQYGERVVNTLVPELAKQRLTIISGLALGIDALAHRATLDVAGRTIAVLGCGLDQIYPVSNTRLADKIIASGGAVISEFPLGTPALKYHFPLRNRIIAGMTLGTLVVEGAVESGSLITARSALDYNREVYAVPGSIFSSESEGPNNLLKMGAKPVLTAQDILEDLDIYKESAQAETRWLVPGSQEEEIVLKLVEQPKFVDEIVKASGLEPSIVNSTLIMLEMKGMVKNLGGTTYVINGKIKNK